MDSKACTKCHVVNPISNFHTSRGKPITICKACKSEYAKKWRSENTSWDQKGYHALWRCRNREALTERSRRWKRENPEKMKEARAAWKAANPDRVKEIHRRASMRALQSPGARVSARIRSGINATLRGKRSMSGAFRIVGYTREELITHLERQFLKGMGWENMGEWHIDHIIPLSSFHISSESDPEMLRAWGLANLRPIWAKENLLKSSHRTHLI